MNSSTYNNFLHRIEAANDAKDKELLARIKSEILSSHSESDNDVARLLHYFKFHV